MHWFDIGVGIALLVGGVWSLFRGLTREVLSILGIITAFVLSFQGYPYVAEPLESLITQDWLRQAIGFGLIFLATVVFYMLFAKLLHRLVKAAGLSLLDRVLGGLFGLIKVSLVVSALLLITAQFFPLFATQLAKESLLAPTFFRGANLLSTLLPEGASDEFRRVYNLIRRQFPVWIPAPKTAPVLSRPPAPTPPASVPHQPHRPNDISESDARALEKILRKRLREQ
jgi:membrane protein required for colicin V production